VLAGLAPALLGALLVVTPLGTEFEQDVGLAWLFGVRGAQAPPADVVVVAIDSDTAADLGPVDLGPVGGGTLTLQRMPRDWPRTVHALLLDELTRRGASVVALDMDFSRPKVAGDDRAFAEAVGRADRVVLFQRLTGKRRPLERADGTVSGHVWVERTVPPIPELAASARAIGPFPLPKLDETLFQFWAFKSSAGGVATMPSLVLQLANMAHFEAWRALLEAAGAPGIQAIPARAADIAAPGELQSTMIRIREAFQADPGLAPALREWLQGADAARLPEARRHALGALVNLYAGEDSRFLNFYGPAGTIATVPYHAVLRAGAGDASARVPDLAGKAVFVGFSDLYDPGQPDRFYTVFTRDDGVDLSGVEVAATAYANMATGASLRTPSSVASFGLVLVFGLVLGALLYRLSAHLAVPVGLVLVATYVYAAQTLFADQALWLPLAIPVLVQLPLALLVGLLGQYLIERRQKMRYSAAVSYYLPEAVARDLADSGADVITANEVVYATCLATDMAGFTGLGERMAPGELATFMNDYFEALAEPLKRHGVTVTEFRADAIMCAWTAREEDPETRRQAAYAALDAMDAVARFSARKQHPLQCRIGLDVGHVYVGHAGGGGHFVYSIVGDCANTAARVESLNKQLSTQLLATGPVLQGLDDLLVRPLGRFVFVGKREPLAVGELVAYRSGASDAQRRRAERFAEALDAFDARRWDLAQARFQAFVADEGPDPVCEMYLHRCAQYLVTAPTEDDPCAIVLDRK
jgi:adenylate cyclase